MTKPDYMRGVTRHPEDKWPIYLTLDFEERDWTFSRSVQDKALELLQEDRVIPTDDPKVFRVKRSDVNTYRVSLGVEEGTSLLRWVTCSCTHGSRSGFGRSRCSHVFAVLLHIRESREA